MPFRDRRPLGKEVKHDVIDQDAVVAVRSNEDRLIRSSSFVKESDDRRILLAELETTCPLKVWHGRAKVPEGSEKAARRVWHIRPKRTPVVGGEAAQLFRLA